MLLPVFEVVSIGFPFCAFKIISGQYLGLPWLTLLGGVDLVFNTINLITLLLFKKRKLDACLLSLVVRWAKKPAANEKGNWQYLGNSIDVLISFGLVAWMVGRGNIPSLSPLALSIWNSAVVLNVLGAGLSQISSSIKKLR